jgi:hypothetical protein
VWRGAEISGGQLLASGDPSMRHPVTCGEPEETRRALEKMRRRHQGFVREAQELEARCKEISAAR